ncbi:hypothetical protein V8V88_36655, partial [Paenibacillus phytohabitans]
YFIEHAIDYIPGGGVFHDEAGYNSATGVFDWPALLSAARYEVMKAVWIPLFPAIALTLLLLTFQLLSEGFRKVFERQMSSGKNRVVYRMAERVSEALVASRMVGGVTLVVLAVAISAILVKDTMNTSTEADAPAEEELGVVEEEEINEDDPFGDGRYTYYNKKLEATTIATTAKGGYYDKLEFLESQMEKKTDRDYETDTLTLKCRTIGTGRCEKPIITFKEPVPTVEEAYQLILDHLPTDATVKNESQKNESEYIYNVTSSMLKNSYHWIHTDPMLGELAVIMHMTPEKTVEQIEIDTGYR